MAKIFLNDSRVEQKKDDVLTLSGMTYVNKIEYCVDNANNITDLSLIHKTYLDNRLDELSIKHKLYLDNGLDTLKIKQGISNNSFYLGDDEPSASTKISWNGIINCNGLKSNRSINISKQSEYLVDGKPLLNSVKSGILSWDIDKNTYLPYSLKRDVGDNPYFYSEDKIPDGNKRLNLNASLYVTTLMSKKGVFSSNNSHALDTTYCISGVYSGLNGGGFASIRANSYLQFGYGLLIDNDKIVTSVVGNKSMLVINRNFSSGTTANIVNNIVEINDSPKTRGVIGGKILNVSVDDINRIIFDPRVVDGKNNSAYVLDTHNLLLSTNRLTVLNNGTNPFIIESDGSVNIPSNASFKINNVKLPSVIWQQTQHSVIENNIEKSIFNTTNQIGSLILKPNFFNDNKIFTLKLIGNITTKGINNVMLLKIKLGFETLVVHESTLPNNLLNNYFELNYQFNVINVSRNGRIIGLGKYEIISDDSSVSKSLSMLDSGVLNTYYDNVLDISVKLNNNSSLKIISSILQNLN